MPNSLATCLSISGKTVSGGLIATRVTRPILSIAAVTSAMLYGDALAAHRSRSFFCRLAIARSRLGSWTWTAWPFSALPSGFGDFHDFGVHHRLLELLVCIARDL